MGRIRVLPDMVANQIAAGEVVERPASAVKELLENSLDAGAGSLRVEIENGGRRLIRVADDGCGMSQDDALLAFERHATSKLASAKDLLSIATLGFRGEALPSIASVSRLLLETRAAQDATGNAVEIAGGKLLNVTELAKSPGTVITVRDLFFNVPARKKFLRSEQTELAHIASLVTHYSLAHPDKTFLLRNGAAELLHVTPVHTLEERVFQVFGPEQLAELIELAPRTRALPLPDEAESPITLTGFVSRPQVQKNNRNSIFIFVNGRLIRDRLLLHALSAAYYNLIPPACFPFALLFLRCDPGEVDVNVHPSKTEVRFRHQSVIHDFVRDAIREQLMRSRPAPAFAVSPTPQPALQPAAALPYSEFSQMVENAEAAVSASGSGTAARSIVAGAAAGAAAFGSTFESFALRAQPGPAPRFNFEPAPPPTFEPAPAFEPAGEPLKLRVPASHGAFDLRAAPATGTSFKELRPLGQLHESFILATGPNGLWIIDQHVAHERILFERVLKQRAAGNTEVQRLLLPLVLRLNASQQLEYARIAQELHAAGFETEPFGQGTIAVSAAPAALPASGLEQAIYEILEVAEQELRKASLDDLRRGIAASLACRAAIKINTRLDTAKMEWLLRELALTDYPMACPHGRPVALEYSTHEILKAFHRI